MTSSRRVAKGALAVVIAVLSSMIVAPIEGVAAQSCPTYEFIGARGSGEEPGDYSEANNYGMGTLLMETYREVADAFPPGAVAAYGVHYPAVTVWNGWSDIGAMLNGAGAVLHLGVVGGYTDSVEDGKNDVLGHISQRRAACGNATRFILAGYSQGAQAVGDALEDMSSSDRSLVAGAVLFGDPKFNAESWSSRSNFDPTFHGLLDVRSEWPSALHGKVFSYCHRYDPICNISNKLHILGNGDVYLRNPFHVNGDEHTNYVEKGDTSQAARQLALVLDAPNLPGLSSAPIDVVFVIDSTGSMGPYINGVKANVEALVDTIASTSDDFRFALVDYKDEPAEDSAYQARVDVGFTTGVDAFSDALDSLSATGGGDTPESVYAGVMTGLELPWRNGVRKSLIVIGDAPGKDPEPITGHTLETVRLKALAVDPAQVYSVPVGGDTNAETSLTTMAETTGGLAVVSPDTTTFVESLKAVIVASGTAPLAALSTDTYRGLVGEPLLFSAAATQPVDELVVAYDWDFDGDGTYDETTDDPIARHVYDDAGTFQLVMRARSESDLAGTATASLVIEEPAASPPDAPAELAATAGDGAATLSWRPGSGPSPVYFTVTDGDGTVIDRFAAPEGAETVEWTDLRLTNGQTYHYQVSAGNERGDGPAAGPVEATPVGAASTPGEPSPSEPATTEPPAQTPTPASTPEPSGSGGGLATTGWSLLGLLLAGILAIAGGIALVLVARRRRIVGNTG